jgi:hypothetical protein
VVVLLKAGYLRLPVKPLEAAHPRVAPLAVVLQEAVLQEAEPREEKLLVVGPLEAERLAMAEGCN